MLEEQIDNRMFLKTRMRLSVPAALGHQASNIDKVLSKTINQSDGQRISDQCCDLQSDSCDFG